MSISIIQTRRVMEDIIRTSLSGGIVPTIDDVLTQVAEYFSKYPNGLPLPLYVANINRGRITNVDTLNETMANIGINLEVLFEACMEQIHELMSLHSSFNDHLTQLKNRRKRLENMVDDYLLSQFNSDGYFYSISDTFSDTGLTDLNLTSAYVDTPSGTVSIPSLSNSTRRIPGEVIGLNSINVEVNGASSSYRDLADFTGAVRSLSNSFWGIEVDCDKNSEVVVRLSIRVAQDTTPSRVSRIEFEPYGVSPVQLFIRTTKTSGTEDAQFGRKIETSTDRMVFIDTAREVSTVNIVLRKTKPDYVESMNNGTVYRYIFGAKEIAFLESVYDNNAVFVTKPLGIPETLIKGDYAIDAVSLYVEEEVPENTSIEYYIAQDVNIESPTLNDFDWKPISPISDVSTNISTVVRFNGATKTNVFVKANPKLNDLQLIALDDDNQDLTQRNPSPVVIPGVDMYRICKFTEVPLLPSLSLLDGVNTVRVYAIDLNEGAVMDLDFWSNKLSLDTTQVAHHQIDEGNQFFYGGVTGRSGVSLMIETRIEMLDDIQPLISEFSKSDANSKTWDVRVFLDGRELGWLPKGTDSMLIPWPLKRGSNHISLLINIPYATSINPNPYLGSVDLMKGYNLYDYGLVSLGTWSYVDSFDMEYNTVGVPNTFTIKNDEIVSRSRPTGNMRLSYATANNNAPTALRFRANLERSLNSQDVTPLVKLYRLRFGIGDEG